MGNSSAFLKSMGEELKKQQAQLPPDNTDSEQQPIAPSNGSDLDSAQQADLQQQLWEAHLAHQQAKAQALISPGMPVQNLDDLKQAYLTHAAKNANPPLNVDPLKARGTWTGYQQQK